MRIAAKFSALASVILGCLLSAAGSAQDNRSAATITISAAPGHDWKVTYRLPQPAAKLVFARSPDASRTKTWVSADGFELVATPAGEVAQRLDGAKFEEASFTVPPRYSFLPDDYAPFSPFGDGSMLFHSARMFACADLCSDGAAWSMQLDAPGWSYILVDGRHERRRAAWTDKGEGQSVYVGSTPDVETRDLIAIIDRALPASIREQLERDLPKFMSYFSARLGSLPSKPTLFVSYDLSHPKGNGRQGGTLEGQVFVHFYGSKWQERMASPDFGQDLAWHLAHEAGHVYQRQISAEQKEGWWIHEGSAEASAAIALRASDASMATFVESQIAKAREECGTSLEGKTLHEVSATSGRNVPYTCGLILNLSLDAAVRRATSADGLFAVWRNYIARVKGGAAPGEAAYFAAIGEVSNAEVAEVVRKMVEGSGGELLLQPLSE